MNFSSVRRSNRRVYLSVPHLDGAEFRYVQEAFETNWLSTVGPNIDALEKMFSELVGLPCVALACGTAGIHLGLKLLGVGPGDEVVTPTLSFAASCNPIRYEGATPILIDSDPASWNLDPELLASFLKRRARLNRLPKAVVVVHLFGQSADLDAIIEICRRYEIPVLEDAAESLGAFYKGAHPGTRATVGIFSFNGNKIITGTTGGMLVAQEREQVERARKWSTQARDPDPMRINRYVHSELGYNYRMSNVIAGIVRGQLEALERRVQERRAVFERYRAALQDLPGIVPQAEVDYGAPQPTERQLIGTRNEKNTQPDRVAGSISVAEIPRRVNRHSRWLSCFLIDEKRFHLSVPDLIRFLEAANIEARPVWKPLHTQPLYRACDSIGGQVAEDLSRRGICFPSSSCLSESDQTFVIECIQKAHFRAMRSVV
jgi:pyridoxal phosphate-dependent aminotransferase EpsN